MAVEPVDPDGPIESRKFFCHAFLLLREGTRKKTLWVETLKGAMKWFDQWSSKRYGTVMVPMTDAKLSTIGNASRHSSCQCCDRLMPA